MALEKLKIMTNLADSGQDDFVENWGAFAKSILFEFGISRTFLSSEEGERLCAKVVTDMIEDGNLSTTTDLLVRTYRVNHPHEEDNV